MEEIVSYKTVVHSCGQVVKECEALALRWCSMQGFNHVRFESDAHVVVQAVTDDGEPDSLEFGDVVRSCRTILQSKPLYSVWFVQRVRNEAAHVLAHKSRILESPTVKVTSPSFLLHVLNINK
ncbi:hypothetical protein LINGRAHAP2_LOCUS21620 [Linum grandiflorum]